MTPDALNNPRFRNLEEQRDDVATALRGNMLTNEVAVWLADLHIRVRECEMALLKAGLAVEKPEAPHAAD